ncbi:unnamed protein product, partial [Onchocerca ochengi]
FVGFVLFNYLLVDSIFFSRFLGVSFYNYHSPAYALNVPPLPDSFTEEAFIIGLHWKIISKDTPSYRYRRVGYGYHSK